MSTAVSKPSAAGDAIERVLVGGDLSKLSPEDRVRYYNATCDSLGLNPLSKPFDYITLNGKLVLYAKRDATDQLRKRDRVSVSITAREEVRDVYVVTARATTPDGRTDESVGAVNVAGLKGDALANAFMKAETKAKRRVTLSICGLGWLDETEVETVHVEHREPRQIEPPKQSQPKAGARTDPPRDGVALFGRLKDLEAAMVKKNLCEPRAVTLHVEMKGEGEGYPPMIADWTGEQIEDAMRWAREFRDERCAQGKPQPAGAK